MMTLLIILAMLFVLAPIAQGYAKRLERPLPDPNAVNEIGRLREEVDRLASQVNRLEEEQSFLVRLLSEGEGADRPVLPPRRPPSGDAPPR